MSNRIPKNRFTKIGLWGGFSLVILFLIVVTGEAAYNAARPITTTGGRILQSYLWAMENITNGALHKGVDFSYATGTNVYAVASGEVVGMEEDFPNGDRTSTWGNYVMIRHDQRHYDRTASQWAYVYSMYIHLSEDSIEPDLGDHVDKDELIAHSDDTGAGSLGPHLHLQIVVHPLPDRVLRPNNTLDSENRSRNPELWLSPYTYDENTARAVGKVTDLLGNPVSNLKICGMQKPYGNYAWSRTYSYPWANPDDILVENFATTDVSPGTYHLYAQNENDPCDHQPPYRDLGMHTFVAGKTTYIGLHPVWLPYVRTEGSRWTSTIHVRNNSNNYRAKVHTTFFQSSGEVNTQFEDTIYPNGTLVIYPPNNFFGSALVVSSQDIAVAILTEHNASYSCAAYAGVTEPNTNLFVPLVHRNNGGWNSEINLHNTGLERAQVQIEFIPGTVGNSCTQSQWVDPNATWKLNTSGLGCLGYSFIGSARVTSAASIASADFQYRSLEASLIGSSSVMTPSSTLYAPLIQNDNFGWKSGFTLQNATNNSRSHSVIYKRPTGRTCRSDSYSLGPYKNQVVYPAPPSGSCSGDVVLSAMFTSSGAMNAQVNQIIEGGDEASGYPAIASPTTKAIVPYVRKDTVWHTGLQIRNTSDNSASVTVRYFNMNGSTAGNSSFSIPGNGFITLYPASPTNTFYGSAVVECTNGRNIAVVVNHLKISSGASGDVLMSHVAPNR